jgi:hypothetical protein
MCYVLLLPSVNAIAVKYIYISYHIIPYDIFGLVTAFEYLYSVVMSI